MENNRYYYTGKSHLKDIENILNASNYSKLESTMSNINSPKLFVIDSQELTFWECDDEALLKTREIILDESDEKLNLITFKQIQSWLN